LQIRPRYGFNFYILLLGSAGSTLAVVINTRKAFSDTYPDLLSILVAVVFAIFGLLCLRFLLRYDRLLIADGKMTIRSILGYVKREIYLDEISRWMEVYRKNKYDSWYELTIYTANTRYKLSSNLYDDYERCRKALVRGKQRDYDAEARWEKRSDNAVYIIFPLIALFFFVVAYFLGREPEPVKQERLVTVSGKVSEDAQLIKTGRHSHSIKLQLKNYPGFFFDLSGRAFEVAATDAVIAEIKTGDSVFIDIEREEYDKKLAGTKPLDLLDRMIAFRRIDMFALSDTQYSYLELQAYNANTWNDKVGAGVMIVFGLFFAMFTVLFFRNRNKGQEPDTQKKH
jgi:hypothetical protein